MFLTAVILVLQELLEAALLISVMLALGYLLRRARGDNFTVRPTWVAYAIFFGFIGAWIYAHFTPQLSSWFDYVGQEVVNALLQVLILLWLGVFSYLVPGAGRQGTGISGGRLAAVCMIVVVTLSIIREVSEIILYVNGIAGQPENITPVLFGGLIAGGIGISCGIFLFYSLVNLPQAWSFRISMVLLALFTGDMASQAVQLLTQADWLPYTPVLWDSSFLVQENTVTGQLLYALVGYEATPSMLQATCYLGGALIIIASPMFRLAWRTEQWRTGHSL